MFAATSSRFACKIAWVVQLLEKKVFSKGATKRDGHRLKTEFAREFTIRMGLILGGAVALLFGLLKVL